MCIALLLVLICFFLFILFCQLQRYVWTPARQSHFLFYVLYERPCLCSTTNPAEVLAPVPFLLPYLLSAFYFLSLLNHPRRFPWTLSVFFLLPSFSWTVLICVSLFSVQNLQGHMLSAAFSSPALGFLYPGSIPCFSSSSSILSASTPALALPRSFNPSSSGSAAIKEAYFNGARYRSISHRTRRSLCSAVKAFKTVCALQQGRQSRTVKDGAMILWLGYVIVISSCVSLYVCALSECLHVYTIRYVSW